MNVSQKSIDVNKVDKVAQTTDQNQIPAPHEGEPYLLTPGPLTTAYSVKQAMLRDWVPGMTTFEV